jgi:hypothetical protein
MLAVETDLLHRSIEKVLGALETDAASDPVEWLGRFTHALGKLARALRAHVHDTESPGGSLTELEDPGQDAPATLDRQVNELRMDHMRFGDRLSEIQWKSQGLRHRVNRGGATESTFLEIAWLRQHSEELLTKMCEHDDKERKLVHDAVNIDVGVGD